METVNEEEDTTTTTTNNNNNNNNNNNSSGVTVDEAEVRRASALLGVAGGVPLDVARTVLAAHHRTLRATHSAGRQRLTGGFIQCPSCSTPWIAALCKPRLLGCPRNTSAQRGRLRRILRRAQTHPGKLTSSEKSLLSRYQNRENVIEVSCLVCRHRKLEFFPVPERLKKKEEEEEEEEEVSRKKNTKRKKKKRKVKEVNAGLRLSSTPPTSSTLKKKKERRIERDTTSPIVTLPEEENDTINTHTNTHNNRKIVTYKNNSSHPRFKPRAKVLLNKDEASTTLPHPASAATPGMVREKKKRRENLKKIIGKEKIKSEVISEKNKNTLSSFLGSLF